MLFGIIGASMGTLFGAVGGLFAGIFIRITPLMAINPMAYAGKLILSNRPEKAKNIILSALDSHHKRLALKHMVYGILGKIFFIEGHYMPENMTASSYLVSAALISQFTDDRVEAARLYIDALEYWPANAFALNSLAELVELDELAGFKEQAAEALETFEVHASDTARAQLDAKLVKGVDSSYKVKPMRRLIAAEKAVEYVRESSPSTRKNYLRVIENPSRQVSNGEVEAMLEGAGTPVRVKLAAMQFQLILYLAEAMFKHAKSDIDFAQMGWVPIDELIEKLPWTVSVVTSNNVHKLVYKLRKDLENAGLAKKLIEENQNGFYRLQARPDELKIELSKDL